MMHVPAHPVALHTLLSTTPNPMERKKAGIIRRRDLY